MYIKWIIVLAYMSLLKWIDTWGTNFVFHTFHYKGSLLYLYWENKQEVWSFSGEHQSQKASYFCATSFHDLVLFCFSHCLEIPPITSNGTIIDTTAFWELEKEARNITANAQHLAILHTPLQLVCVDPAFVSIFHLL